MSYPNAVHSSNPTGICSVFAVSKAIPSSISQRAIQCWNNSQIGSARSVLIEQESALSVVIDLEETFESQLKSGKISGMLKAWMKGLKLTGRDVGVNNGYDYESGRVKLARADYVAF